MKQENLGYAQALLELSIENNNINEFLQQAKELLAILKDNDKWKNIFLSKQITKDEKKQLLNKVFKDQINSTFLTGLKLMIDHSRFNDLEKTLEKLITLINKHNGIKEGIIYSIKKISPDIILQLEDKLSQIIKKKVHLKNHIDTNLIGGIKVVIDNKIYDNSLATQLKKLKSEMMKGQ